VRVRVASNALGLIEYPGYADSVSKAFRDFAKLRHHALYVLQDLPGGCAANCAYCNQARSMTNPAGERARLCNYEWPSVDLESVLQRIRTQGSDSPIEAVCIQTVFHAQGVESQRAIVKAIRAALPHIWITTATTPRSVEQLEILQQTGLNAVCVCFEAATPELFDTVKGRGVNGPYRWEKHLEALASAKKVFANDTMTHLIIGLGETEHEAVQFMASIVSMNVGVSLFPYLPIAGTPWASNPHEGVGRPDKPRWRRLQLARYLLKEVGVSLSQIEFVGQRISSFDMPVAELRSYVDSGKPFLQSGCKFCSRLGYAEDQDPAAADFDFTVEPFVFPTKPWPATLDRLWRDMDIRALSSSV
jgi:lipoyl synthase